MQLLHSYLPSAMIPGCEVFHWLSQAYQSQTGASTPWGNDAFPLCFRFSPYFKKYFRLRGKFSQFYLFPKKFLDFHPTKFLMTFFSHQLQILNFPLCFRCFSTFLLFRKIFCFPHISKFSFWFLKIYVFFTYFHFPLVWPWCILCITQCTYWTPLQVPDPGLQPFLLSHSLKGNIGSVKGSDMRTVNQAKRA